MKVAHLSDLHITEGPALDDQRADLRRVVDLILDAQPDLVVLTGDYYGRTVPHRPTPRERAVLEPELVRLADVAPVLALEGNHDHGEALGLARQLGGSYPITVLAGAGAQTIHTPAGPVQVYHLAYPTRRWLLAGRPPAGVAEGRAQALAQLHGLLAAWGGRMTRQRVAAPEIPILFLGHFQVRGSTLSSGEVLSTGELEVERAALSTLPVDYGALGHVHARQEVAPGVWYVGDPWPVDFGEVGPRGFHLVDLKAGLPPAVEFVASGARPWVTVRYRWAADREDGAPRWIERPSSAELQALAGAVVRARLVVPDVHAASCPWDAELEALGAIAHRLKGERVIEPTVRVRAPEVAAAATLDDKVAAWWNTLEARPDAQDQAAALDALAELQSADDEQIAVVSRELLDQAKVRTVG
jgi:exonuclease SbcD